MGVIKYLLAYLAFYKVVVLIKAAENEECSPPVGVNSFSFLFSGWWFCSVAVPFLSCKRVIAGGFRNAVE